MVKYTHTIRRLLPKNCLCVFDHFVGLALKDLHWLHVWMNRSFQSTSKCRTNRPNHPFLKPILKHIQVAIRSTILGTTAVIYARLNGRFIVMPREVKRKKLQRTNQGFDFLRASFSKRVMQIILKLDVKLLKRECHYIHFEASYRSLTWNTTNTELFRGWFWKAFLQFFKNNFEWPSSQVYITNTQILKFSWNSTFFPIPHSSNTKKSIPYFLIETFTTIAKAMHGSLKKLTQTLQSQKNMYVCGYLTVPAKKCRP